MKRSAPPGRRRTGSRTGLGPRGRVRRQGVLDLAQEGIHRGKPSALEHPRVADARQAQEALRLGRGGEEAAVLCLDLDRFKAVNDTLGHGAGDELLRRIANRLVDLLPPGASGGRLGGDEFAALIPDNGNREDLAMIANNIVEALTTPFAMSGTQVAVGASLGIVVGPEDGSTVDMLVRNADLALYRSKNTGGSKYTFYESWMLAQADGRMQLEKDQLRAREGDQLHRPRDSGEHNQKRVA